MRLGRLLYTLPAQSSSSLAENAAFSANVAKAAMPVSIAPSRVNLSELAMPAELILLSKR